MVHCVIHVTHCVIHVAVHVVHVVIHIIVHVIIEVIAHGGHTVVQVIHLRGWCLERKTAGRAAIVVAIIIVVIFDSKSCPRSFPSRKVLVEVYVIVVIHVTVIRQVTDPDCVGAVVDRRLELALLSLITALKTRCCIEALLISKCRKVKTKMQLNPKYHSGRGEDKK